MKFVILAAGNGTRMCPLTQTMSKPMIPVANKPLLEWYVEKIEKLGTDIILVVRKDQKDIREYFDGRVEFAYQDTPKGTADAILATENFIDGKFVVSNSDEIFNQKDLAEFIRQKPFTLAHFVHDQPKRFGVFTLENELIKDIIEKPNINKPSPVNVGLYIFDKHIFDFIRKTPFSERRELEITTTWKMMIENGFEFYSFRMSDWLTVGYPWEILEANQKILNENGSKIHKTAEMRPGTYIEHPVFIGENSIIGPNCYIRKYSTIGKNCKIGNAVEIKNSIIMDGSYVSHLSYVGDSIIGRNCNIAAGTLFANLRLDEKNIGMKIKGDYVDSNMKKLGSIVADSVKFGAGCTIMPGKKIWPNILVPPCQKIDHDIETQPEL
ncbi:MAG: NTP transferase domain-containing protein [Candidatus Aenigmarchaeota archaeon]|nr:NTP transferase domain-containing protein [Candidatus Aenigmarchaeota archaeon]